MYNMYACDVSEIVGPSYSVFSVKAADQATSPIIDGDQLTVTGKKGFSASSAVVTLACPKGAIEDCMSLLVLWNPFRNRTWH